ncbi:MAG: hypothetical protein O7B23_08480, partial [Deltaproteobacteria bacterium]|nr:hypothetical protein [Deltaproteobacteria bacterium]
RTLHPWVAIASAGRRPRSPIPPTLVSARLQAESVTLYETRRFGAVRVRFTRVGLVVDPFLRMPWSDEPR